MSLFTPLGLLGLIGIPILIVIYIIKPKYHEKTITSTFIWKLSLKYRKKKLPLQWLQKSLLFFVQVLIITLTALLLARPLLEVSAKDGEKVVILDVSASMTSVKNNETRLDRALNQLNELANKVNEENKLTVILAGKTPQYLLRRETSSSYAKFQLTTVEPTYEECNFDDALTLANTVIEENPSVEVLYYTDCHYENSGYVNVVDFSDSEWNVGILDFNPVFEEGYYKFVARIGNYNKNADLQLMLSLDNGKVIDTKEVSFKANEEKEIVWDSLSVLTYENATLTIKYLNSSNKYVALDDALPVDDTFYTQNLDELVFDVQLVGYTNTFMSSALKSVANINLYLPKDETEIKNSGYDLYVYDSYLPETLPSDGAIWVINPVESYSALNLTIVGEEKGNYYFNSTSSNSEARNEILNYVTPSSIEVTKYTKLTNYSTYDVLVNCNDDPVILTGRKDNAKIVVFAFDLHYSNLPISLNMAILINNMFNYCVHNTIEQSVYSIGDNVTLYTTPATTQLRINNTLYMSSTSFVDKVSLVVEKPGIYEVQQTTSSGNQKDKFFVRISENESNYSYTREFLAVDQYINIETGTVGNPGGGATDYEEASKYFAGALLLFMIIEWGLQYREQY